MSNNFIRNSETDFIVNQINLYLKKQQINDKNISLIDVGCGNGYTLETLSKTFTFDFYGIELTDSLRKIANDRLKNYGIKINKGDIRKSSDLQEKKFQILLSQRVLINLLNRDDQLKALDNLIAAVKKGELLIFIECFNTPLYHLNKCRKDFLLDPMSPSHHNLYLQDKIFNNKNIEIFDDTKKNFCLCIILFLEFFIPFI